METLNIGDYTNDFQPNYNRQQEIKAFDDTKLGVKGLVDSGVTTLPKIFIRPPEELVQELNTPSVNLQVPLIDFHGIHGKDRYEEILKEVMEASEKWGFFQIVNHGIPQEVVDKMLQGIRMFHEQDDEVKKKFYGRDMTNKQVIYLSNYDLYASRTANWRDSLALMTSNFGGRFDPEELPEICRSEMLDYIDQVLKLNEQLLELLSMGLGLEPDYLKQLECDKGWHLVNHYYPACPVPDLTLGTSKHSDPSVITILLQNHISGLQVLHQNQWVDVQPIPGAFIINIGDILQIISNDKLKSVDHRVIAKQDGPRISVALLLKGDASASKLYGPIKELLSEDNPALYKEFTLSEFYKRFYSRPLDDSGSEYLRTENQGNNK